MRSALEKAEEDYQEDGHPIRPVPKCRESCFHFSRHVDPPVVKRTDRDALNENARRIAAPLTAWSSGLRRIVTAVGKIIQIREK
jgi:hypothetical protein